MWVGDEVRGGFGRGCGEGKGGSSGRACRASTEYEIFYEFNFINL